ncbi:MAG TPA: tetratricopeptide repeat protein [Blastocatellia bacterium]|nr:tetratricopeptide repeat protein [Blastocatellia bacterium]
MVSRRYAYVSFTCALYVLALLHQIAISQSVTGNTIKGKVRTQYGEPAANLHVELQTGLGVIVTQTVTNNEGDYAFYGLTGASFVLVINDPIYQPFSERVEFTREAGNRPGETLRVDITLAAKAAPKLPRAGVVFNQDTPEAARASYQRGVKLLAERKSDEGIAALREAIKIFGNYFDAHLALGVELLRLRRHAEAIEALERARSINPKDSRPYQAFGLALYEQKKFNVAASVFEAVTRLDSANAEAQLMKGAALIEMGRFSDAETALKNADRISEHKLPMVHIHLARLYEKMGDRKRAADELEKYLSMKPDAENAAIIREAIKKLRAN